MNVERGAGGGCYRNATRRSKGSEWNAVDLKGREAVGQGAGRLKQTGTSSTEREGSSLSPMYHGTRCVGERERERVCDLKDSPDSIGRFSEVRWVSIQLMLHYLGEKMVSFFIQTIINTNY